MQPRSGRGIYIDILIALFTVLLVWSNLCSSCQHKLLLVFIGTVSIEALIKPQVFLDQTSSVLSQALLCLFWIFAWLHRCTVPGHQAKERNCSRGHL